MTKRTPRSMTTALLLAGFCAGAVHGQAIVYEPFSYSSSLASGDNIEGADGGVGFAGTWVNTRNSPDYVEPGNTYGSLVTSGGRVQGNAWSGISRPIGSALADANLLDDGATLWFSVIFDLTGQNTSNADLNLALTNASKFHSSSFGDRENLEGIASEGIGVTHSGAFIQAVHWQNSDGNADTVSERSESPNSSLRINGGGNPTSAFIVGKIEWGATGSANETITLYNPDPSLDQGSPILSAHSVPALNQSSFDTIALQFKDTPQMDEIRFGATFADVAVLPDPLVLEVNTVTGQTRILGATEQTFDISYYQVTSDAGSLNPSGWDSLADQDFDGNGPPSGTGNGWEEAGGADALVLAEGYLLGSNAIAPGNAVDLGLAYDTAVDAQDLFFSFLTDSGDEFDGIVQYVATFLPGDTDFDGDVDDADLGTAFSNYTGPLTPGTGGKTAAQGDTDGDGDIDDADLGTLFSGYTGPLTVSSVPEPGSLALLIPGGWMLMRRRRLTGKR